MKQQYVIWVDEESQDEFLKLIKGASAPIIADMQFPRTTKFDFVRYGAELDDEELTVLRLAIPNFKYFLIP